MVSAQHWTEQRNLSLRAENERETLIYILGRVGREPLPPELWIFLAEKLGSGKLWSVPPEGEH